MTPKQRMRIAMTGGKPDRVPACPDISEMIPCRLSGRPSWEFFLDESPFSHYNRKLGEAYLKAVKYFGIDGWDLGYVGLGPSKGRKVEAWREIIEKKRDYIVAREYFSTPDGELWQEIVYPRENPPWHTRKLVKDFKKDFPIYLEYFFPDPSSCDDKEYQRWKSEVGEYAVVGLIISAPGFQQLINVIDGGLETLVYYYYDYSELFSEYVTVYDTWAEKMTKRAVQVKPDFILTGGSGTITLSSPDIFRKIGLPTLKKITRIAKQGGIPTILHSCDKERELIKMCVEETDLDCINPLESPPMGDCDLPEIKQKFGDKIALMGNLHTTEVMLQGNPKDVEKAAKKCIDDAAEGGGYILSTGDQCGRDTPEENIFKLVEIVEKYGRYS